MVGHFSAAGSCKYRTMAEWTTFDGTVSDIAKLLPPDVTLTLGNTMGTLRVGRRTPHSFGVRVGWGLYGLEPCPSDAYFKPMPATRVAARIVAENTLRPGDSLGYNPDVDSAVFQASRSCRLGILRLSCVTSDVLPSMVRRIAAPTMDPFGGPIPVVGKPLLSQVFVDLTDSEATVGDWLLLCGWDSTKSETIPSISRRTGTTGTRVQIALCKAVDEIRHVDTLLDEENDQ